MQGCASDANVVFEGMKEDVVINSVKCSREVEKDEEGGGAGVRGHQEVIGDSDDSCLGAVGRTNFCKDCFSEDGCVVV